jgi:broad specificity phosphatase PhoE
VVGARLGLEHRLDVRLVETDCGDWTDRLRVDVEREDPDGVAAFLRADPDFAFPGGESLRDQTARVMAALDDVARGPRPVLVVTHGMAMRLVFTALGHPLDAIPNAALLDCCGAASSSGRAPDF